MDLTEDKVKVQHLEGATGRVLSIFEELTQLDNNPEDRKPAFSQIKGQGESQKISMT
jgi:hypothetical protein